MPTRLAMADATVKLLIAEGAFTDDEVKAQPGYERADYLVGLKRVS
ncbi:MAG TPA: hypothetical protein VFH01_08260 [Pyrinomonadaceae bacterium]|nr:hypothetical protein [Pyrinomonadaceae bacterium]